MVLRQPQTDALVSFSDFLLERFGLVASMQVALASSIAFHMVVIIGVGLGGPRIPAWDAPHNVMDVVLVNAKSARRPEKADALAQANLEGGGNTDQKVRAKTPFPAVDPRDPAQELRAAETRMKQLETEAKEMLTQLSSKAAVAPPQEQSPQGNTKPDPTARDLIERSLEIQRLEAQIAREHLAYQQRPRRQFVGARAQEYRFAVYVDKWRQKIERIGTLNYPDEAKRRNIHGSLQLTVAIKANGEIESVEINRSSGYKVLDQAALRIVRLAAPFDRFPDNVRVDTDILHITRTWHFTSADQVMAE